MGVIFKFGDKDFHTKRWSGGTTTELFIYPPTSSLKKLDFDFRISTATIEVENSTFTPLPGVKRGFTLLEGKTKLKHEGHHQLEMKLNEVDEFLGEWKTSSEGKCTPFNLMTTNNCKGNIHPLFLKRNMKTELQSKCDFILIYCNKGNGAVLNEKQTELSENELIVLTDSSSDRITFQSHSDAHLVIVYIELNK